MEVHHIESLEGVSDSDIDPKGFQEPYSKINQAFKRDDLATTITLH